MQIATVSEKGQVVIPAGLRRSLGIKAGTELGFELEGGFIRVSLKQAVTPSQIDSGYGLLRAKAPAKSVVSKRRLSDFDVAQAMRAKSK